MAKPSLNFPTFLLSIVQDRATVSSVCAVRMSSQSFARADEYDKDVTVGNLRDVRGIDRVVAFFAKDPVRDGELSDQTTWRQETTLR